MQTIDLSWVRIHRQALGFGVLLAVLAMGVGFADDWGTDWTGSGTTTQDTGVDWSGTSKVMPEKATTDARVDRLQQGGVPQYQPRFQLKNLWPFKKEEKPKPDEDTIVNVGPQAPASVQGSLLRVLEPICLPEGQILAPGMVLVRLDIQLPVGLVVSQAGNSSRLLLTAFPALAEGATTSGIRYQDGRFIVVAAGGNGKPAQAFATAPVGCNANSWE